MYDYEPAPAGTLVVRVEEEQYECGPNDWCCHLVIVDDQGDDVADGSIPVTTEWEQAAAAADAAIADVGYRRVGAWDPRECTAQVVKA